MIGKLTGEGDAAAAVQKKPLTFATFILITLLKALKTVYCLMSTVKIF